MIQFRKSLIKLSLSMLCILSPLSLYAKQEHSHSDSDSGKRGKHGHRGKRGYHGRVGEPGLQGVQGPQGHQGSPGSPGVQGPPGAPGVDGTTAITDFISVIAFSDPFSNQPVAGGAPVLFNMTVSESGSISGTTPTGVFTLSETGTYEVTYGGPFIITSPGTQAPIIALQVGGVVLPQSRISSEGDWQVLSLIIDVASEPTTIEVVNNTPAPNNSITIARDGGNVGFFLAIKKIA